MFQTVFAPVSGRLIDITAVSDEVFAEKTVGDGMAIEPTDGIVLSPADGIIEAIFPTNHAFIIAADNGASIMVHIGIETVAMNGRPFVRLAAPGSRISAGDPVIKADFRMIRHAGLDPTVIVVNVEGSVENKSAVEKVCAGDLLLEAAPASV